MRKFILTVLTTIASVIVSSGVTFNVTVPSGTKSCYIAGDFNGWDAANAVAMNASGTNTFTLTLDDVTEAEANVGYKYLCGPDWAYVEKGASGEELSNRTQVTEMDVVASWAKTYNSDIIETKLTVNGYTRIVKVLLPSEYATTTKSYPVVYMTGVQARYDKAGDDADRGDDHLGDLSWNIPGMVQEVAGADECIFVSMYGFVAENTPFEYADFAGSGAADSFIQGIEESLMPYINSTYRTLKDAANTSIVGGDLGGLFSVYAAVKRPDLFGQCAALSPTIWLNKNEIINYVTTATADNNSQRFYLSVGGNEPSDFQADVVELKDALLARANADVRFTTFTGASHNDVAWGESFRTIFPFLLSADATNAGAEVALSSTSAPIHRATALQSTGYSIVSAVDSESLVYDSNTSFTYMSDFMYEGAETEAQVAIVEIPVSVKTKYYWNVARSTDGTGDVLKSTNGNIGFSSKKSTTTWLRVVVLADETVKDIAANSEAFRVVTDDQEVMMTPTTGYMSTATVSFGSSKTFKIYFGSVNSGSKQSSLTEELSVGANCTSAVIEYDFLTNNVTVTESVDGGGDDSGDDDTPTVDFANRSYSIVSAVDSESLVYDSNTSFTYMSDFIYEGAETEAQVAIVEIPVSVKTKYYWNVARSTDGTGDVLKSTNGNIGFSSKKSTTTWLRVVVLADETVKDIAANSEAFRVVTDDQEVMMTPTTGYKSTATVSFGSSKTFKIYFGSVNSGSKQSSLTEELSVGANCTSAVIEYDFLSNNVTVTESVDGGGDDSGDDDTPTVDFANRSYSIVSAIDSQDLVYDANSKFNYTTKFISSGSEVEAQVAIVEIPASVKTQYYWNVACSADGSGELLKASSGNISFSSKKSTTTWHRVAVLSDETVKDVAANSAAFRLVTADESITMSITGNYTVKATAEFLNTDKSFTINYGSVNSGSDMGAITGSYSVGSDCIAADIIYDFLTNSVTITETKWGETINDVAVEKFIAVPSICNVGSDSKVTIKIPELTDTEVSVKVNHNYGTYESKTLTKVATDEWAMDMTNLQAGIYHISLCLKKGETEMDDYRTIAIKVLDGEDVENAVVNPYSDVDWSTINQYKANFHTHTTQSFDANLRVDETVDYYYNAGYKILALTEHDANPYPWDKFNLFNPMASNRFAESLNMLAIPGNELSKSYTNSWNEVGGSEFNHHNDFFTGRQGMEFATLRESYAYTEKLGGMQLINHPGQYWSLSNTYTPGEKNSPEWHAENFLTYKSLIGLEVYNQGNRRPNDRILWDQILDITMAEGTPVWGYSCDDMHNTGQLFRNYNFMLMPELTIEALKDAMRNGTHYFSYEYAGSGLAKAPRISDIVVDAENHTITIDTDATDVYWICSTDIKNSTPDTRKSTVLAVGKEFDYTGYQGKYVRALLTNEFGETCTQPFGFVDKTSGIEEIVDSREVELSLYPNPASDILNIKATGEIKSVKLYDIVGRCVLAEEFEGMTETTINVAQLISGNYIVAVETENTIVNKKLIIK